MIEREVAFSIQVVATFCNGQGDNFNIRVCQALNGGSAIFGCMHIFYNAADNIGFMRAIGRKGGECVQVVLFRHNGSALVFARCIAQAYANNGPALLALALQNFVDIHGLMGAMKIAHAKMRNACRGFLPVITRRCNLNRKLMQCGVGKRDHENRVPRFKISVGHNVGAKRSISKKAAYVRLESDGAFR